MKRIYGFVAGAVALGVLGYLSNYLWAQPGAQPNYQPQAAAGGAAAAPQGTVPRVAVINMYVVLKNYQKWEFYRKELQNAAKRYEEYDAYCKAEIAKESNRGKSPEATAQQREDAQKNIKDWTRKMEDNAANAQKALGEKGELQTVQMYKEVEDAVKSYALAQGIHLVLSYTDLVDQPEFYSARNITRKLMASGQAGAACPLYIAPGLDISQAVVTMLNNRYPPATTPTAAQPPGH